MRRADRGRRCPRRRITSLRSAQSNGTDILRTAGGELGGKAFCFRAGTGVNSTPTTGATSSSARRSPVPVAMLAQAELDGACSDEGLPRAQV
jgi:hypothetical protein